MTVSMFEPMTMSMPPMTGVHPVALPRAQVGIERLPTRRLSNEPRESMNCKSCRKRKIKCNRLRPACEACQVFQCPCVYDAVPKKRGPKTDVLEALLKRVDGLEAKLKEKNSAESPTTPTTPGMKDDDSSSPGAAAQENQQNEPRAKRLALETKGLSDGNESAIFSPMTTSEPSPSVQAEALLDTYFMRFHAKPYYVLDESSVRQRLQLNQVPNYLLHAIYAVAARYTPHPNGYQSAVKLSEEYAARSRAEMDIDEPSVDGLQALILLVIAFTAAGKGKKAYMLMTNAVGMAMALEIHREMEAKARITPVERETRRRIFWTCYLLDRFLACGSKRPSLIADKTILLRLPCWSPPQASLPVEGEFFQSDSNLQYLQGSGKKWQGSTGMLIDIARILGITNRYLAAGGVKGDSHFPWHSLSTLSKIRQDLDTWASGADDVFASPEALFGQADSTVLVLSKLIYHLIHCLIYRPFLPIDLSELAGTGQHQSWQIEATNMCFFHANTIAELVEMGKQATSMEWPAFVGYAICTAGTVHIHGTHYSKASGAGADMAVFSQSGDFLSREMQQLSELRYAWASVQHQREILQGIYNAHAELAKSVGSSMGFSPGFHLEDFFDRYSNIGGPGGQSFNFDAANLSLSDVVVDFTADAYSGHDLYAPRVSGSGNGNGEEGTEGMPRPMLKRKNTATSERKRPSLSTLTPLVHMVNGPRSSGLPTPHRHGAASFSNMPPPPSPMMTTPNSLPPHPELPDQHINGMEMSDEVANNAAVAAAAAAGFAMAPHTPNSHVDMAGTHFSSQYTFNAAGPGHENQVTMGDSSGFDPMFGGMATSAYASPPTWQGGEKSAAEGHEQVGSPGAKSNPSTGADNEKDPFLSMLEQLAENEGRRPTGRAGGDLDFFFTGNGTAS